jgi:hypothetical protein
MPREIRPRVAARPGSPEQPRLLPPCLRMHRQHVDDVGPVVAKSVAVAEQLRGVRVTVGLVVDHDPADRRVLRGHSVRS